MQSDLVLDVRNLTKVFSRRSGLFSGPVDEVRAVDDVSFTIARNETFGLIGESGSGKTTTAKLVMRLLDPSSGNILFQGEDVAGFSGERLRRYRRNAQIVFQDPDASLNPRRRVDRQIREGLDIQKLGSQEEREQRVIELMELVHLPPKDRFKDPNAFSGGQKQRIAIARALALNPDLLVLDEPVSALDVSIRNEVLRLLDDLQDELNLAYLFVAHDLALVRHFCDRIAVMYQGRIVEAGESRAIYETPQHPYTQALLSAVPIPDPAAEAARVRLPMPTSGFLRTKEAACRFAGRYPAVVGSTCSPEDGTPGTHAVSDDHTVACIFDA